MVLSIVLFIYTPGEGVQWEVFVGSVVVLLLGELAIWYAEHERKRRGISKQTSCA